MQTEEMKAASWIVGFIHGQDKSIININSKQTNFPAGNGAKCKANQQFLHGPVTKGAGMAQILQAAPESHKSSPEPSCLFPSPCKPSRCCSSGFGFAEFGVETDFHWQQIFQGICKNTPWYFLFQWDQVVPALQKKFFPVKNILSNTTIPLIFCITEYIPFRLTANPPIFPFFSSELCFTCCHTTF